ncbi:mitoguardin 2-like [Carassius auratus]|uniref:Mitoguardin 2 n=1 Tax=Carassius auratus TaxID=7957 RepID=A0A6P6NF35_CARAU|nr:mitoguardin 2-like [Carassius auratus]XP_026106786.1 mitoguardin 2-like [Carassius auratus]
MSPAPAVPGSVWSDSDVKVSAGGRGGAEMSIRSAEGVSIMQALAMTVAEIPVFLYSTFGQSIFSQLKLSPSLKKVLFATALGSVALALTAHQLKRRSRKRKQIVSKEAQKPVGIPEPLIRTSRPASLKRGPVPGRQMMSPSARSNDTLSGVSSLTQSKHSSSSHSIASMRGPSSPNQSVNTGMLREAEPVAEESGVGEDANAENLYLIGMELFEEALRKWELALNVRHRADSCASGAHSLGSQGAELVERHSPELHHHQFAEKLESLLHRAYHLQEDFGSTIPADVLQADLESEATLILPTLGSSHPVRDDDASSDDSFFSAAELFEAFSLEDTYRSLKPAALYEEALGLVKDGGVACRSMRTELLECYSDEDFLAKLHCVRQAFQLLLLDETHRMFFMDAGKQIISGLLAKANKSPEAFLESYEDMLQYTQREETWPVTKMELEGRGVVCMNFFDMVLDFILMDAFEDLESPPSSVVAVLRNRWLSDSFKKTALATACWSVLKAKRRLLMVPDGFIAHFYAISEHVSPVLAFGFLGPPQHLSEVCTVFKQQIVQYLKDMFDHDKVRFTSVPSLAEDILSLSHRRADILVGYLGIDSLPETNGALPKSPCQANSRQQD